MILLSCSKHDNKIVPDDSNIIRFSCVDTKVESASDIDAFGVFIEQNLGPDDTPLTHRWISLLENDRVYRNSSKFTYDNKRYWVENRTFFFFGVYPYGTNVNRTAEENNVLVDGVIVPQTTSLYSFDVSIPYAANTDYMVAQKSVLVPTNYESFNPSVDMNFEHLLSRIAFNIKKSEDNAEETFIVTQVGLSGLSRNGVFTATHAPNSYRTTLVPTVESRPVRRSGLSTTLETTAKNVFGENGGLLVIPQKITNGQIKLSIEYTYKQTETSELQYATLEVDIPTDNVNEWKSGKSYTYSLELMIDNKIYIGTPTVSKWGSAQQGGTIIIK